MFRERAYGIISRMKNTLVSFLILLVGTSVFADIIPFVNPDPQTPVIEKNGIRGWIRGDRTEFAVGETAVFSFTVPTNATKVALRRFGDDRVEEKFEIGAVTDKGIAYASKLDKPGTVSVELTCDQGSMILGAVFGLNGIRGATAGRPADFDAYWDGLRAQAQTAAKSARVESYKNRNDGFTVTAPCGAKMPMTAGYSVPADAAPKSCTALIEFPGYCPTESAGVPPAMKGRIWMNFNPHGSPIGHDPAFYENFAVTNHLQNYGFERDLNEKRETSYFHDMVLRLLTTLAFVKTLPQWNGRIEVAGGSQGGFLSLLAASLDPSVRKVNAMMPWLCDFDSERVGYHGGWHPEYTDAMAYYFPLYHIRNIRADEVSLTAGLADTICAPYGIIAVYNELPCPKSIELYQGSGHCIPSMNAKLNVKRHSAND